MKKYQKKIVIFLILSAMIIQTLYIGSPIIINAEETSIFTDYFPEINEVKDANGFIHPGVGLTKDLLENVRTKVRAKAEPWNTYFNAMLTSNTAGKNVVSSNKSGADPSKPDSVVFNSQGFQSRFIADGLKAYTQALLYYITGDTIYRANALHIIRIWSQMDPTQYVRYPDCHIHTGVPLNRMVMAAEILRYTSCEDIVVTSASGSQEDLKWTEQDTLNFTNNLITPVIETFQYSQNYFMNQHNYPLMGSIAGHIFTGNRARYNELIEWYTVNSTAKDQGFNGSIKQLFRLVDQIDVVGEQIGTGEEVEPRVQHVEMGRDQAHGGGDLTNAAIINRMLLAQETKVDPEKGTVSEENNAVGPYEFLEDRILKAADFFWEYMLGYEPEWIPVAYSIAPDGRIKDTYNRFSQGYKGRFLTANFWDLYSYYTYVRNENIPEIAPHYYEAFTKKLAPDAGGWQNVDAGNDFWLYLPEEAEADGEKFIPRFSSSGSLIEVEDRATNLHNTETLKEDTTTFIRFSPSEEESKIALLSLGQGTKTYGLKLRSNGTATLEMLGTSITVTDTKGQWKYFTISGNFGDFATITVKAMEGVSVDLDHIHGAVDSQLTPPVFKTGTSDLEVFSFIGAPLTIDFSATDAGVTDLVTYEGFYMPEGANLNKITGILSYTPTQTGITSFIIAASDGTAVTAKKVNISVETSRSAAVSQVIAPYKEEAKYELDTLFNFKKIYEETLSQLETMSAEDFGDQLAKLRRVVEGLKLITPLLPDGSMDYSTIVTSSLGSNLSWLIDGDNDSFGGFRSGKGNLYHTFDFGADYKVSVSSFGLQSRMNFVDRAAGSALFGSNDNVNWVRLTTGETAFSPLMSYVPVDEEFRNEEYRYLKVEIVNPHDAIIQNAPTFILEWGELRIWGERFDANNMISSVSISSEQSSGGRIKIGDAVQLTIQTREKIEDMTVTIQGLPAMVTTVDYINWTATAFMTKGVTLGDVKFTVDYKRADGSAGDRITYTTDNSKLVLMDDSDFIENIPDITNLFDSSPGRTATNTLSETKLLFDKNIGTFTHYYTDNGSGGNQGWGSYITFDFKTGNQVSLRNVEIAARQDQVGRISGTVIQGSNDNETFKTISTAAVNTAEWQTLTISDYSPYRYIRVYNGGNWFGNMSELAFYGEVIHLIDDAIEKAVGIDRTIYTADSLQILDDVIGEARALQNNTSATQDEVDTIVNKILTAIDELKYIEGMPIFDDLKDKTVNAEEELTFIIHTKNAEDTVTYEVSGLPAGATFDSSTGTFRWIPNKGGNYSVTFTATMGEKSSSKTINIKVIGAPVIEEMESVYLTARDVLNFQVNATEPAGIPLIYTCDKLPTGALLNPATGRLTWTPGNEHFGSHTITFIVSNGQNSVSQTVTFHVGLYVYEPIGFTKGSYYMYNNEIARIKEEIEKPDANKILLAEEIMQAEKMLEYFIKPGGAYFFNGNTKDIHSMYNGTTVGTIAYADGKFGQAIDLNGSYVQLPVNHPISNAEEYTIATWLYWRGGNAWQRAWDFGTGTNQYMFLSPRSGSNTLRFAIKNGGSEQIVETGQLPANGWVHVAVTYKNNTAKMYVDGVLKATNNNVTIKPSDFKPNINYIGKAQFAADPIYNGQIDQLYIYDYALEEDRVKELMGELSDFLDKSLLETLVKEAEMIVPEVYTEETGLIFTLALNEGKEVLANVLAVQPEVDIAAANLQNAIEGLQLIPGIPVIVGLSDQLVKADTVVSFKVNAVNGESIIYTVSGLPQGAEFDAETQVFKWKPLKTQSGTYEITFTVRTEQGTSSKTINIRVIGAPHFISVPVLEFKAREESVYSIAELVDDPAGLPLTYKADNLPSGAILDSSTGVLTWNPGLAYYGSHFIRFRVSNGEFEITQTIEFQVDVALLSPEPYTRASYFLYEETANKILEQLKNSGGDIVEQILKLGEVERQLVPLSVLPLELASKFDITQEQVIASHPHYNKKDNEKVNGWYAFDGNTATYTDATAAAGWILVDFGENQEQVVHSARLHPRFSYATRVNGAMIQGSNDGITFTDLGTISGVNTETWHRFALNNVTAYRYIRYSVSSGNVNVAEIEYYSLPIDKTLVDLLLNRIESIEEGSYPVKFMEKLWQTAASVEPVMSNPDITQEEIDSIAQVLKAALDDLKNAKYPVLEPAHVYFDKEDVKDVVTEIIWNDAEKVIGITEDGIPLPEGMAVVSGSGVVTGSAIAASSPITIKGEFLKDREIGNVLLNIQFDYGRAELIIIIVDSTKPPVSAEVNPTALEFDKANPKHMEADIIWNDARKIIGIRHKDESLTAADYSVVSGSSIHMDKLMIHQEYIEKQTENTLTFTIIFDKGEERTIVISVIDSGTGTDPGDPGTDPGDPGTDPGDPGTDPGDPGTDPGDPGTDPGDPGTDPGDPGTDPEDPGTNPGAGSYPISSGTLREKVSSGELELSKVVNGIVNAKWTLNTSNALLYTDSLISQLKSQDTKSLYLTVEAPKDSKDDELTVRLDSRLLNTAIEESKDITVSVTDKEGKELYTWTFDGSDLAKADKVIWNVNLTLQVKETKEDSDITSLLSNKNQSGWFIDFSHNGALPSQAAVKIYVGNQSKMPYNKKLYIYHYNEKTGKLETLPYSSKYKVDKDGYLTLNILHSSKYVILEKAADSKAYTSLREQIKVIVGRKSLYATGNKNTTTNIMLELPYTLEVMSDIKDKNPNSAVGSVVVSYSSDNKKVATVDRNGKIIALKKGTANITTKLTLYSGKVKTVTTKITVK